MKTKKLLSILLAATILVGVLFLLTGCTGKANKTYDIYKIFIEQDFYLKYKGEIDGEEATIELSRKGKDVAMNVEEQGYGIIITETTAYIISHEDEMVIKGSSDEYDADEYLMFEEDPEFESRVPEKGKEEIDGKTYDYEDFDGTRYYYEKNTIKYIKDEGGLVQILELTNKAKDSLFEIPENYEELEI